MEQKTCTACKLDFPATTEYFYKMKRGRLGLGQTCKECDKKMKKEVMRIWRETHQERCNQQSMKSYYKHKEKYNERKRMLYKIKSMANETKIANEKAANLLYEAIYYESYMESIEQLKKFVKFVNNVNFEFNRRYFYDTFKQGLKPVTLYINAIMKKIAAKEVKKYENEMQDLREVKKKICIFV